MPLTPDQLALFVFINYKFSTTESGRLTSLYFEDPAGNQGRWRREHRNGEALIYQGKARRLFVSPTEVKNYQNGLENDVREEGPRFGTRANGDYKVLANGATIQNISLAPVDGWHVLELCPPQFIARHGSGGTVDLNDQTAGAADFAGVGAIANTVVW